MKRRTVNTIGIVVLLAGIAWFVIPADMAKETSPYIYTSESQLPQKPVAIVLGARVYPDGTLSPVLQARVDSGIELYRSGKVQKLVMSGDNSSSHYNEPTAMKRYAVAQGVPAKDIIRDYAGLHTYDTCYRATHVFGITSAIFVSQAFHLSRTVFLARHMGIDAVGYVAPNDMSESDLSVLVVREHLATLGALFDLGLRKKPKYSGPVEPSVMTGTDPNR